MELLCKKCRIIEELYQELSHHDLCPNMKNMNQLYIDFEDDEDSNPMTKKKRAYVRQKVRQPRAKKSVELKEEKKSSYVSNIMVKEAYVPNIMVKEAYVPNKMVKEDYVPNKKEKSLDKYKEPGGFRCRECQHFYKHSGDLRKHQTISHGRLRLIRISKDQTSKI